MNDQFDVSLQDDDLMAEVELTTDLMIAASECEDEHMSEEQIDAVLRVPRQRGPSD